MTDSSFSTRNVELAKWLREGATAAYLAFDDAGRAKCLEAADALERLSGQNGDDKRDAERYRWIANQTVTGDWGHHVGWILHLEVQGAPSLESFDQAIDAARSRATPSPDSERAENIAKFYGSKGGQP